MRIVVWAAVVLVLSVSSLVRAESKGQACKADSDCALVAADCCGCKGGGKQKERRHIPVDEAAREKASYERKRQACCADTLCTTVMSRDSSCAETAAAVCKEGQCSLAQSR